MLRNSNARAIVIILISLSVGISVNIANAKQPIGDTLPATDEPLQRPPSNICIGPRGPYKCPRRGITIQQQIILETRPELNDVTSAVAIKQLEALRSSGKATNDDYILLGYFYSLEKKYNQSRAYYLEALELATDEAKKDFIKQELEKLPTATFEVKPVDK